MKLSQRERMMLAVLFAAGEPLEAERLAETLEMEMSLLQAEIGSLNEKLREQNSPLEIKKLGDSFQLCTTPEDAIIIRKALEIKKNIPLSAAAMEVLAIIAYNQPVTRGFVEQVRGVDSSSVVASLVEKGLIEEAGRMDLPGRPLAFKTTTNFLRCFGLQSLEDLPTVEEQPEEDKVSQEQLSFAE